MELAIEAVGLRKTYPPAVTALNGLSLSVPPGTIFALLGPNGAGKSTTVRVLCTLTRPDSGSARVAGLDVLAEPTRVRRAIGVVGQKHGADPEATGRENLVLQGEFYGLHGRVLSARVAQSLERFNLSDAASRRVKTYSGGMQRRLDIAMGLLHSPEVLFLDEPTTGLDPEARAELWLEIERLAAHERMTILLTTHYMEEADRLAARLAIVDHGRIVAEGTSAELKDGLEGDTIQIDLGEGDRALSASVLEQMEGMSAVVLDGRTLRARTRNGGAAVPLVLAALETRGVKAESVTVSRPSLEDVYLRYAGRELTDSENDHEIEELAA